MNNFKWATPLHMRSLSDSTPGQSLTPLAMTVTTNCHLPESFAPLVTCLQTSRIPHLMFKYVVLSSRHTKREVLFIHSATRPRRHLWQRLPPLPSVRSTVRHQPWLVSLTQTNQHAWGSSSPHSHSCALRDRAHQHIELQVHLATTVRSR